MITFCVETSMDALTEMKALFPLHWEELALNKEQVPLDPQYEVYEARYRAGELLLITAREAGELVGYFVGFAAPGLHYRTCLTLTMDIFYIVPKCRGRSLGIRLFKQVEQEARRRGVKRIFAGSKLHKDASILFERLGYQEVERYYSLWTGD